MHRRPGRPRRDAIGVSAPAPLPARTRFLEADAYRVAREWNRYEGTPQRDLFRELRERFLRRHSREDGWAIDLGAGPMRYTPLVGGDRARRVALDLSRAMLRWSPPGSSAADRGRIDAVQGDGIDPPVRRDSFNTVALLGNTLGFAGPESGRLLKAAIELVGPGGVLLVEVAPGPGEHSRYLARLPATAVGRLLRAPPRALLGRIEREGFEPDPPRRAGTDAFRRMKAEELRATLERAGFHVEEVLAVAPALGSEPERVAEVRLDPKGWEHLLAIEETLGRSPERWPSAAAVLLAAARAPAA